MRTDRFADERRPLLLKAQLDEPGFKAKLFGHTGEDCAERDEWAGANHLIS